MAATAIEGNTSPGSSSSMSKEVELPFIFTLVELIQLEAAYFASSEDMTADEGQRCFMEYFNGDRIPLITGIVTPDLTEMVYGEVDDCVS